MPYQDFRDLTTAFVRDDESRFVQSDIDSAIDSAVRRYSTDKPALKVVDVVAAGGFALAVPAGWQYDFSELLAVEYPIGSNPPSFLERETFRLYDKTDGTREIRFDNQLPNATVRISFTQMQQLVNGGADTVPIVDREAVCKWAAASLCDQLAALYSNTQDSTISADAVQYTSKASQRRSQAQGYRKQYNDYFGIDDKKAQPAAASATVQLRSSTGAQRIFHGRNSVH
jgi:hypothetical protein